MLRDVEQGGVSSLIKLLIKAFWGSDHELGWVIKLIKRRSSATAANMRIAGRHDQVDQAVNKAPLACLINPPSRGLIKQGVINRSALFIRKAPVRQLKELHFLPGHVFTENSDDTPFLAALAGCGEAPAFLFVCIAKNSTGLRARNA